MGSNLLSGHIAVAAGRFCNSAGISSTKVINGTATYIAAYPDGDNPSSGYTALAKADGALMIYEEYDPEDGTYTYPTPQLYMPAQPTLGSQWTYTERDGEQVTATCVAVNETVSTYAGTFTGCILVKRQQASGTYQYHWYAPNVGEVRFYDAGGDTPERDEIVSWVQGTACDTTPPSAPTVTDEGTDLYGNMLCGTWTATDAESSVVSYKVAVSTSPDESGILSEMGWREVGGMTQCPLLPLSTLVDGNTYYLLAKAASTSMTDPTSTADRARPASRWCIRARRIPVWGRM